MGHKTEVLRNAGSSFWRMSPTFLSHLETNVTNNLQIFKNLFVGKAIKKTICENEEQSE